MKIIIGRCYVKLFTGLLLCAKTKLLKLTDPNETGIISVLFAIKIRQLVILSET